MKTRTVLILVILLGVFLRQEAQAYYNPSTGRWLSRDPIGEKASANLFGFARGSPISFLDRLGLADVDYTTLPFEGIDDGLQKPHDNMAGAAPLKIWIVNPWAEDCSCKDRAHVNVAGRAEAHYWWSDKDLKTHEEHHIEIWKKEWDSMKSEIEPYTIGCLRRKRAECYLDLIRAISAFHEIKGYKLNADFDCKAYGNVEPFKRCDAAKEYEKQMKEKEQKVRELQDKCGKS